MQAVVRCVLAVSVIAASALSAPAGVGAAASQFYGPGIASVLPTQGEVVGVAHPVVVTFTAPVVDRSAAQRALKVSSQPAMTGRYEWLDNKVVQWVPDAYWPAHS